MSSARELSPLGPDSWHAGLHLVVESSRTLAVGRFSLTGGVTYANRGMRELLGLDDGDADPTSRFRAPPFSEIVERSRDGHEHPIYEGLMTFGSYLDTPATRRGRVTKLGEDLLVVAEHDVDEHERTVRELTGLNQEVNNLQRELIKEKRQLRRTLDQLAKAQHDLVQAARLAGMSDLAAEVLHNFGNALNSANVSIDLFDRALKTSRLHGLEKVAELLATQDDLGAFMSGDRGSRIPRYLAELYGRLEQERCTLVDHSRELRSQIDQCKAVVAAQEEFRSTSTLIEEIDVTTLLERAIAMTIPQLEKLEIELVTRIGGLPTVHSDRHLLLQVVMNLFSNARDALTDKAEAPRRLTVRAQSEADDLIRIEVEDTGVGIASEHLERIFESGFSTRPDGRGFGLHTAANAARTLGGDLTVRSAGPGRGATFTLITPRAAGQDQDGLRTAPR